MIDLSVIVPVYNVEKYVRTCIESIYRQGLDENRFELIIVNDGTKDKSMEMIADIIQQHSNIVVIEQENQGLSVARNNGLAIAKGEYILMPDSDDLLIDNSVKPLLEKALSTKVDMIIADFKQMGDSQIEDLLNKTQPIQIGIQYLETIGTELLEESLCRYYWRSLYKKEFLMNNHISFTPGITNQDVPFTNECLLKAKRCLRTSMLLVVYRWGHPSTTSSTYTLKRAQNLCIAISKIWEFTKLKELSTNTKRKQEDIVFTYFYTLISAITFGHIKDKAVRLEIVDYLKELVPDLNFRNGVRQRIWSFAYRNAPHTFINFRYMYVKSKKVFKTLSSAII